MTKIKSLKEDTEIRANALAKAINVRLDKIKSIYFDHFETPKGEFYVWTNDEMFDDAYDNELDQIECDGLVEYIEWQHGIPQVEEYINKCLEFDDYKPLEWAVQDYCEENQGASKFKVINKYVDYPYGFFRDNRDFQLDDYISGDDIDEATVMAADIILDKYGIVERWFNGDINELIKTVKGEDAVDYNIIEIK